MRRRAREAFVLLGLLVSAALAGCSSAGGVTEASPDRFPPEAIPRPPQSIPQADLGARPDDTDGAHEAAAGGRLLRTEHMLDAGADAALRAASR